MAVLGFAKMGFALLVLLSVSFHVVCGEIICEDLPKEACAFSISSVGKRCLLEKSTKGDGSQEFTCRSSEVIVEKMKEWIETDECVQACGVDRNTVGISSDSLLERGFIEKLCSPACYGSCANIIDLYFNLAAGEGIFLPDLCETHRFRPHRLMAEILSSGEVPSPTGSKSLPLVGDAPASSPM